MGRHPQWFGRIMRPSSSTCWSTSRIGSSELQFVFSLLCLHAVFCIVHVSAQHSPDESVTPKYFRSSSMNTNPLEGLLNGTLSSCCGRNMFTRRAFSLASSAKKAAGRGVVLAAFIAVAVIIFVGIASIIVYCYYQSSTSRSNLAILKQADIENLAKPRVRGETMLSFTDAKGSMSINLPEELPNSTSPYQQRKSTLSNSKTGNESDAGGNSPFLSLSKHGDSTDAGQKGPWATCRRTYYRCLKIGESSSLRSPISFNMDDPSRASPGPASIALSAADVKKATRNFKSQIGVGGFGPVYFGKLPGNQMEVAVKVQSLHSRQGAREFATEVEILSRCKHPNLVSLIGYSEDPGRYMLIYEFLSGGTLQQRLYGQRSNPPLDWHRRLILLIQAAKGLEYLHNECIPSIIHRDVKSCNILLTKLDDAKVTDFGLSRFLEGNKKHISACSVKGTCGYLDPEYFQTQTLTQKSDIYSFGVVLLEVISGLEPLDLQRNRTGWKITDWTRKLLLEGEIERVADKALQGKYEIETMWTVADLAMACVEPQSVHRPTIAKVVLDLQNALRQSQLG